MRSFRRCFGAAALVACVVCLLGCNQQAAQAPPPPDTRATDEAAIRAASAEWAKVAAAKDLEKTLSYHSDDASMFPPNMPIATGPEARREAWTEMLAPAELVFSNAATKVEAARSGDLAYEIGTFEESFKDGNGKPVKVVGKYVVVWKKQPTGQWKAIADIFNTNQ
jgi:ketosteroid isomerase-like protein